MSKTTSVTNIQIHFEDTQYPFYLGCNIFEDVVAPLSRLEPDRLMLVTDQEVWELYRDSLIPILQRAAPVTELVVPPGEEAKSLGTLERLVEIALRQGASRRSIVVTFGGGVAGNLGGLFAALLFRGIRLVHLPTSLVAILDSVISLKQAVNSRLGKNLLGTYYPASFVWADTEFLFTLSEKDFRSGICELVKNALAIQPERIPRLREWLDGPYRADPNIWDEMIRAGIEAKLVVMSEDKHERKRGIVLEYGHTIGHAIEILDFQKRGRGALSHGESVALGMLAAAMVADKLGLASRPLIDIHRELIEAVGVRTRLPKGLTSEQILQVLCQDNKKGYLNQNPGQMSMILLEDLGRPVMSGALPLHPVPVECIQETLDELSGPPSNLQRMRRAHVSKFDAGHHFDGCEQD